MAKNIFGIIIGETRSAEEAEKLAEMMKNCPYLIASGTTSNKTYSIYIVENITYPEKFDWKLPKKKTETTPCGADCQTCPLREEYDCGGCPATIH